jgi:hypothetical protein
MMHLMIAWGQMAEDYFRACGSCGKRWRDWQAFLDDPGLRLLGLQSAAHAPETNIIVFEHSCGSSVSVLAAKLRHLIRQPKEQQNLPVLYGTEKCAKHCAYLSDLAVCQNACANAADRRLVRLIKDRKDGRAPP